ncbi:MAG: glycosyltransferase family 39 protein [Thermoleophilaceae bacterium]
MPGTTTSPFPRLEAYAEQPTTVRRWDRDARMRALAKRPEALAAGGIVLLYVVTRLLLLWRMPHFIDEATHAGWTYDAFHHPADRFESLTQAKEPLLVWLATGFMKLGASPLTAIRWVTFFAGLLTMTMVGLLGRRLGGNRLGLAAAGVYVLLPFALVHDVIGIMDPLVTALVATALVLQLSLAERPRLDVALGLGIVMAAAVLTKESGKVAAVLLPLSLLVFDWRGPARVRRLATWAGCAAIALALTGVGMLILHLSPLYSQMQALRSIPYAYPVRTVSSALSHPFHWWGQSWHVYRPALLGYVTVPLLIAFVAGAVVLLRTRRRLGLVLLAWVLVPFVAAALLPVHPYPRHILYIVPPVVAIGAFGGAWILGYARSRVSPERRRALTVGLAVVALAPAVLFDLRVLASPSSTHYPANDDVQYVTGWESGSGLEPLAATLRRLTHGRPALVAYTSGYSEAFRFLVDNPKLVYVDTSSPGAKLAAYLVEFPHAKEFPEFAEGGLLPSFRLVQTVHRPRSDLALRLYARR